MQYQESPQPCLLFASDIYGGHLLGVRSVSGLGFFDWETTDLVRRIEIQPKSVRLCLIFVLQYLKLQSLQYMFQSENDNLIELDQDSFSFIGPLRGRKFILFMNFSLQIYWADNGELSCIATEDSFFILKYVAENVAKAQESPELMTEDGVEDAFDVRVLHCMLEYLLK